MHYYNRNDVRGATMDQNLNLYHTFYTVAKCGNISAAANQLFISQPAISKSIARLEQSLDVKLFLRSSRGVSLTAEGDLLYHRVEEALRAISLGEEAVKNAVELGIGRLSIGVSTTLCRYVLLPYLKSFAKEYPNIQVSIRCQSSYETIKALEDGSIDIGLIGETGRIGNLLFHPIAEIEDIFISTAEYMNALQAREGYDRKNPLSLANLILPDQDNLSRRYVDRYLDPGLIDENRLIEVSTMDLVIEFAKNSLGIGCVIGDFVKKELEKAELVRIETDISFPKRKIGFAYRKESSVNKSALAFLSYMKV